MQPNHSTLSLLPVLLLGLSACGHEIFVHPSRDDTDTQDSVDTELDTGEGDPQDPDDVDPSPPTACEDLYPDPTGKRHYVDPIAGDDGNEGTSDAPWASLQTVIDQYVDCTDEGGTPKHNSAPVKGGDTIVLRGRVGYPDALFINGCYNSDYVTLVGETRREPVLRFVKLRGSAYWHFEGLTFENDGGGQMFKVENHDNHGTGHHIRMHDNLMTSGDLKTKSDFASKASDGIRLTQTDDVSITCNQMVNVAQGMTVSGSRVDVLYNVIERFTRDAIVNGGSHNRYIGNEVYDSVKLGDGHHDDFFQSHRGSYPDTATEVEIAYNLFVNRYRDDQPSDTYGATQCIGAFEEEGPKTRWRVYNNVCKTDHYHGITLKDTNDSYVMNNTIVGGGNLPGHLAGGRPEHTWINVSGTNNTVRNNLTTVDSAGGENTIIVDADNVYDIFMDWDGLDLRLKPTAIAVDAGSPTDAPVDDIVLNPRDEQPDVGAYELSK